MTKHWEIKKHEYATILTVLHDWDLDIANEFLSYAEKHFHAEQHKNFIFDLHLVSQVDSMVIGIFISISKKIKKNGGKVFLLKPSKVVENLLLDIGLLSFFNVYHSIEEIKKIISSDSLD
ncbi:MAG: STAS domain-containing protein [Fibrobacteria bacterium]|nr:STAS domain-containing protein [Fibrobacteria bacterium]